MLSKHKNVIRFWAGSDLLVTGLLAFPPIATAFLEALLTVNTWFGGQVGPQSLSPFGLLFVCVSGSLGVVWAVARILRPTWCLGMIDTVARLWVGGLIAYFVFSYDVPAILLLFVLTEWAGSLHQGLRLIGGRPSAGAPDLAQHPASVQTPK